MEALRRVMKPLEDRIRLMAGRAVIRAIDDAKRAQEVQLELLDGETQDAAERFQDYGFTSVPLPGAEAVVIFIGGLRSHPIVLKAEDRRHRMGGLEPGEVAIYDDQGQMVKIARGGIEIHTDKEVSIQAGTVIVDSQDVRLGGEGGKPIARVGDQVDLSTGKILTGSIRVKAA